ncbi:MAG: DUF5034 domain-containing protein [Bacteroidales bacterium]|nr:DUF5034 domain-containing protein [Bacteroidales bacterium]
MRIIKRALLILAIANLIRIIPGCCECDDSTMPFNFNKMDIINLDNSGDWAVTTNIDTMMAEAVAFEVELFDSLGYYYAEDFKSNLKGFSSARAMSCDCSFPLKANHYLTSIRITSLYALSPEIDAGSDVSDFFVASPTNNSSSGSLYSSLETICNESNGKTYYDSGMESFGLYLTIPVDNNQARFVISIGFSDNSVLSDTTRLITIKNK